MTCSGRGVRERPSPRPLPLVVAHQFPPYRFAHAARWNTRVMREVLIVSAVVSLMGVVVWIGLLLWAAREDGRDQRERDRRLPRAP